MPAERPTQSVDPAESPAHIFGSPSDEMLSWVAHLTTEAHHGVGHLLGRRDRLLASALLDALVALMDHFTPARGSGALARTCISGIAWIVDGRALQIETFAARRGNVFDHVLRSGCCFLRTHLGTIRDVVFGTLDDPPQTRVRLLAERFQDDAGVSPWEAHGVATLSLVLIAVATANDLVALSDEQVIEAIVDRCTRDGTDQL